jgi:hypothetical protein
MIRKMSDYDSRKKKRKLNKEEIRQCLELFGNIINKRYDSNKMLLDDHVTLTSVNYSKAQYNFHGPLPVTNPKTSTSLVENKVSNFKIITFSKKILNDLK